MNGHDQHSHQDWQHFLKVEISVTKFLTNDFATKDRFDVDSVRFLQRKKHQVERSCTSF